LPCTGPSRPGVMVIMSLPMTWHDPIRLKWPLNRRYTWRLNATVCRFSISPRSISKPGRYLVLKH
tara:strand:+ start:124989 stop:125183 length:195 start_codon:yes stop_codon:yes gene_type:complete